MKTAEHIADMLRSQGRHVSFHTPGHKRRGGDITELSYSDNLASPAGVIARAESDVARILGAERSFILTDGSTCGVHAMLWALKRAGKTSVAFSPYSHASVFGGCEIAGLSAVPVSAATARGIALQPTAAEMERALARADALLLTSPDYYGNFPDLAAARAFCDREKKPLLVDGAHGSHLHFGARYAGRYADLWVDGVHKSLPALTQGAVVSAKNGWADALGEGVALFRTTSPSYPIMASVEHAVKFPRNEKIERAAEKCKLRVGAEPNADWSKILVAFGAYADDAQRYLESRGVYAEMNDGNYLLFYLSPATKPRELKKLTALLKKLPRGEIPEEPEEPPARGRAGGATERVALQASAGRVCARTCGMFPPCLPLIREGETVLSEKAARLARAKHTFGLEEGKILVYTEE